jgi:chromosome segregation ATPase
MTNLLRQFCLVYLQSKKGIVTVTSAEARMLGDVARLQAFNTEIPSLRRELRTLQERLARIDDSRAEVMAEIEKCMQKLENGESERNKLLGRGNQKLLPEAEKCLTTITEQ